MPSRWQEVVLVSIALAGFLIGAIAGQLLHSTWALAHPAEAQGAPPVTAAVADPAPLEGVASPEHSAAVAMSWPPAPIADR